MISLSGEIVRTGGLPERRFKINAASENSRPAAGMKPQGLVYDAPSRSRDIDL
jgi:hypothetical protein